MIIYLDDFGDDDYFDSAEESADYDLKQTKERALNDLKEIQLFQVQSPFHDQKTPDSKIEEWAKRITDSRQLKDIVLIAQEIEEETGYDIGKAVFNNDSNQGNFFK